MSSTLGKFDVISSNLKKIRSSLILDTFLPDPMGLSKCAEKHKKQVIAMSLMIGMTVGALVAWLIIAFFETSWEDIFPDQ